MKRNDERDSLDQLVATKVFGLRLKKKRFTYGKPPIGYRLETKDGQQVGRDTGFFGWGWHHTEKAAWLECPRYSTDIRAAWVMWEAMAKVSVSVFNQFLAEICALAHTAVIPAALQRLSPEIICKAALRIRGVKIKKLAV